MHVPI
jgi:hypothetical protein